MAERSFAKGKDSLLIVEEEDFYLEAVENGTTERQMRNQFDAWVTFMTASMEDA